MAVGVYPRYRIVKTEELKEGRSSSIDYFRGKRVDKVVETRRTESDTGG